MPPQMGWLHGSLYSPHMSSVLHDLNKFANDARYEALPVVEPCPVFYFVDMAIFIYSVPISGRGSKSRNGRSNVPMSPIIPSLGDVQGVVSKLPGTQTLVILCVDERRKVSPV